jgi:hypothetical protein
MRIRKIALVKIISLLSVLAYLGSLVPYGVRIVSAAASLSLIKIDNLNPATYDHVGQLVAYTLTATNDGDTELTHVIVSDVPELDDFDCDPHTPLNSLMPDESVVCTGTHSITQADLDAGFFTNTASASSSEGITGNDTDTIYATQNKVLVLNKAATEASFNAAGVILHYTLTATNNSSVTLTGVSITDAMLGTLSCTPAQPTTLAPGDDLRCTGTHVTAQGDVNAGKVDNTANASGTFSSAPVNASPASVSVPYTNLSLTKSDNLSPGRYDQVGQVVLYTLIATNHGTITLHNVSVSDTPALDGYTCFPSIPLASLAPGVAVVCTGSHSITQADLDAGSFANTGSATSNETNASDVAHTIYATQNKVLDLSKVAAEAIFSTIGETLHYTLTATNNGNVTLTNVSITDDNVAALTCTPSQPATLVPGEKLNCTGSYLTTQYDVSAGKVDNTAEASGQFEIGIVHAEASLSIPYTTLSLTKRAQEASFTTVEVTLHYTLAVTNTGNATLTGVSIIDDKLGTLTCTPTQPVMLNKGDMLSCTGTYLTTQADVNAGKVDNTANASGYSGTILVSAVPASLSVPAVQTEALKMTKTATPGTYDHINQVISYNYKLENSGNVTITGPFIVIDDRSTDEACPPSPDFLDPGSFITCTASYTIQRADMTYGSVTNTAYATGLFGTSMVTSNTDTETVTATKRLIYTFIPWISYSKPGVQVLPQSSYFVSGNIVNIVGEVLNNTNASVTSVKIVVNFFDSGGHFVGTKNTYLWPLDLPAWEKGCFSVSVKIPDDVPASWNYYQFEAPTFSLSNTSSGLTILNDSGYYNPGTGEYRITGQVRNDGNQYPTTVGVGGTLYNTAGVPVGCGFVNNVGLYPGQVGSFRIDFWGRDYIDVINYRLRVAGDLP